LNPEIEKGPVFGEMFKGGLEKSQKLPELYEAAAKMGGAEFLNAGSVISTDGVDGLDLTADSERKLGIAVAAKVKEMALAQAPQTTSGQAGQPMPPGPNPNSQYRLGPDSMAQDAVPKGNIRGPYALPSMVYPGTQHTYWVYVPAQYDPEIPTALMIYQDGQAFKDENGDLRAQNVMDNLIYRREIPVMIGVFIDPGRKPDQPEPSPQTSWGDDTTNRRTEYNTPDDQYARVITVFPSFWETVSLPVVGMVGSGDTNPVDPLWISAKRSSRLTSGYLLPKKESQTMTLAVQQSD
jgi:hypothetical protein